LEELEYSKDGQFTEVELPAATKRENNRETSLTKVLNIFSFGVR